MRDEPLALELNGVRAGYTKVPVLDGIDLAIVRGSVTGILGANGAGKSTLFKTIAGLIPGATGDIRIAGQDASSLKAYQRARLGLGFVLEGGRCFNRMTVEDNLASARIAIHGGKRSVAHREALALALTAFPILKRKSRSLAAELSGGERQMLAVARGIATASPTLLLDEPSVGLSVRMVNELADAIRVMREARLTLIVAEQNLSLIEGVSDSCLLLSEGKIIWKGDPDEMADSEVVRDVVIGGDLSITGNGRLGEL